MMQHRIKDKQVIEWIKQIIKENKSENYINRNIVQTDTKAKDETPVRRPADQNNE